MAFNVLDPRREEGFQKMLDYLIKTYGKEKGAQYYQEWLEETGYDDTKPIPLQRKFKGMIELFPNTPQKKKSASEILEKMRDRIAKKINKDALKIAMKRDDGSNELWQFRKKVENAGKDVKLLQEFGRLGEKSLPNTPDPQDLRDLKKFYIMATQMSPTSIQARGAKMQVARITEKLIESKQATREQIEAFL